MMATRKRSVVVAAALAAILAGVIVARAAGPFKGHADLAGYQEVPTLSTPATGTLDVEISKDDNSVAYTLSYQGIRTNVLFAHIHIGRPAVNGGVMVFLCTNGAPPAGVPVPPPCPQGGGTVSGELTAADVLAVGASGVAAGDFDAFVDALRAEAGYGNLHSTAFSNGEIRGQVTFSRADSISDN
jgi:hypothetical protein